MRLYRQVDGITPLLLRNHQSSLGKDSCDVVTLQQPVFSELTEVCHARTLRHQPEQAPGAKAQ